MSGGTKVVDGVEWTPIKVLESLQLGHHEAAFKGMNMASLCALSDAELKKLLPLGPSVKVLKKLREIKRVTETLSELSVHEDEDGPVYTPQVVLKTHAQKDSLEKNPEALLYNEDSSVANLQRQLGRPHSVRVVARFEEIVDSFTEDETKAPEAGNFFDVLGLKKEGTSHVEELPVEATTTSAPKDALEMQLSVETGKLMVLSASFSDIIDCVTVYLNIMETFPTHLLFTHRYFCSTRNLVAGFKAHFLNASNLKASAQTPEEAKSAAKLLEQVQDRLGAFVELWVENHFYLVDTSPDVLKVLQTDLIPCLEETRRNSINQLIGGIMIVRAHPAASRAKRTTVDVAAVFAQIFREDKSGLVVDRRKNLRVFKQAFIAVESVNLLMRKLKISDRGLVVQLLDLMRQARAIHNPLKPDARFEDGGALWQFEYAGVLVSGASSGASGSASSVGSSRSAGGHVAGGSLGKVPHEDFAAAPSLLDTDPRTIAEQITLIEFDSFVRITPAEIFRQAWSKGQGTDAPNVMKLIASFNTTTYWVASEICGQLVFEKRVACITRMIEIADRCLEIHNFQTLMEIMVGLSMGPVGRLTQSWEALSEAAKQKHKRLQALISHSGNYCTYRRKLKETPRPCFPYVGLYLKDLTFIEDGNGTFNDEAKSVINWQKMHMIGTIFEEVQSYQQKGYDLEVKPPINAWLRSGRVIITKDDELYAKSLQCQPRGTD